ncbi:hypothetical protein FA95DRAFT_1491061, partial [Auriscalpium vulgare]
GEVIFNPSVTTSKSLADCFRVFPDPKGRAPIPTYRLLHPARGLKKNGSPHKPTAPV